MHVSRHQLRDIQGFTLVEVMAATIILAVGVAASVAAMNVGFPADIAVWIPNILFGIMGIWIYLKAPK